MVRMPSGKCASTIVVTFCLLVPAVPRAAIWHVTYDPEQAVDRVGSVAAQAASEDTILIDPGTYYEHIPLEGKSLREKADADHRLGYDLFKRFSRIVVDRLLAARLQILDMYGKRA